jgi:hypothetical protein
MDCGIRPCLLENRKKRTWIKNRSYWKIGKRRKFIKKSSYRKIEKKRTFIKEKFLLENRKKKQIDKTKPATYSLKSATISVTHLK